MNSTDTASFVQAHAGPRGAFWPCLSGKLLDSLYSDPPACRGQSVLQCDASQAGTAGKVLEVETRWTDRVSKARVAGASRTAGTMCDVRSPTGTWGICGALEDLGRWWWGGSASFKREQGTAWREGQKEGSTTRLQG